MLGHPEIVEVEFFDKIANVKILYSAISGLSVDNFVSFIINIYLFVLVLMFVYIF